MLMDTVDDTSPPDGMFNPPPLVPRILSLITWTDTHLLSQLPLSYYYCSDDNYDASSPTLLCRTVHHNPHPFLARPELHFIAPGTDVDDHLMQGTPDLGLASGTRAYMGLVAAEPGRFRSRTVRYPSFLLVNVNDAFGLWG